MPQKIDDYALIGNMRTAALVGRDGSIDWLCLPRFNSSACCAALVGTPDNGHWSIAPRDGVESVERHYRGDTIVLETIFKTPAGEVALIDCLALPRSEGQAIDLVRIVEGRAGQVPMRMEALFRFDYGRVPPWSRRRNYGLHVLAGPHALQLRTPVGLDIGGDACTAGFTVAKGERIPFTLTWHNAYRQEPDGRDPEQALDETDRWWRDWSSRYAQTHEYREPVIRSLITLKALTDSETGGMVGAPTTSLPEHPGGKKNYDYRFTWLRDATFTLHALIRSGYDEEARLWREWLLRVSAGHPEKLQPMYGIDGEWRFPQQRLDWLRGYDNSRPVHIGNQAYQQRQIDAYGEIVNAVYSAHEHDLDMNEEDWTAQLRLMEFLEGHWREAGAGIWELGSKQSDYTHSKVMAWVAADRAAKTIERFGFKGDAARWRALADTIHQEVCERGYDATRNTFLQRYDSQALDAALLRLPIVGFLPADDPRIVGTIDAIRKELTQDGFVWRYSDWLGRRTSEGAFLICSFWLADDLILLGRRDEARDIFERLLSVRSDVGLLSEQYDPTSQRLLGNMPQAFSHVGLINTAHNLTLEQSNKGN
ncbi:MAG TPA: glycoside hydrolase family 15 protein [Gammaproteobacteria bacterium]|nr:glycoside hydrolase family 15 protein [Gammaproteobacteria bacterium]